MVDHRPEVGGEIDADHVLDEPAVGADSGEAAHRAAGAVAGDDVVGADVHPALARDERAGHAMLGLGDGDAFVAGAEVDLRGLADLLPQHRLEPVLREDGGVDRTQREQRVEVRRQRRAAAELAPGERGDPADAGALEDVLARRDDAVGLSDLAKHLERPRIEDAGGGMRLGRGVAFDQRHPDAGPGEKQRERQSGRPGANHHNPAGSVRHPSFVPLRHLICRPSLPIMHDTQPLGAANAGPQD